MVLRAALVVALLAAAGFGAWEVRRWAAPRTRDLISPRQRVLRAWGLFFLLAALGLWLGGTYLTPPHVAPGTSVTPRVRRAAARYLAYWTLTAIMAVPLIPLALLDTRENLRRLLAERKQAEREAAAPLFADADDRPPPPSR